MIILQIIDEASLFVYLRFSSELDCQLTLPSHFIDMATSSICDYGIFSAIVQLLQQ